MQVTSKVEGPCRKSLQISVPADDVQQGYTKMLTEYKKYATIPGFRPGKAPQSLIEKRFAKEILKELRERLIPEFYHKAVEQEKIGVATVLNVTEDELTLGNPFSYTVLVDTKPEFDLSEYKGITIKSETKSVTDDDVNESVKRLLERFATFEEVSGRTVEQHDVAEVSYEGICEGAPLSTMVPDHAQRVARSEAGWVSCDEDEFLPGMGTGLVGASIGETREITVQFPVDFVIKEIAGKKAVYQVTVKGLRVRKTPPLDAELLKKLAVESEEQLRAAVRKELETYAERDETERRRIEIVKHLLGHYTFELPESNVQEETRSLVYEMVRDNTMRGVKDEEITEHKDEIFKSAAKTAEERTRLHYITEAIADQEKITVSRNEVDAYVRQMAQSANMTVEQVTKRLSEQDGLDGVQAKLRQRKTIDFLLKEAKIEA